MVQRHVRVYILRLTLAKLPGASVMDPKKDR